MKSNNIVYSKNKYVKGSAQKARLVIDQVRGKSTEEALSILKFSSKRAAAHILKTLKSAIANAENNFDMNKENLVIKEARVDESMTLKRGRPVSKGRFHRELKRSCHIIIGVAENVN